VADVMNQAVDSRDQIMQIGKSDQQFSKMSGTLSLIGSCYKSTNTELSKHMQHKPSTVDQGHGFPMSLHVQFYRIL